ncbi:MAG: class I SAM-dependent methyltransferase [Alphaproteobacteria bacterium]|nr:class I SAM-dependent methyltransferase [Alphaproteobacteria bacterium]
MLYIYLALIIVELFLLVFVILFSIEVGITLFRRTAPQLPSQKKLRDAVIGEINSCYPNEHTIMDIGSGWGGMVRRIARKFPKMRVTGIELMPLAFCCSWLSWLILGPKNARFMMGNAIKCISNGMSADIAICYSGTSLMKEFAPLADKFKIVLALDFPLPGHVPVRTIKLHKDHLGQHMLYVYSR